MQWVEHVVHMEQMRNAYSIFVGNPERKRPLGRPRHVCVCVCLYGV